MSHGNVYIDRQTRRQTEMHSNTDRQRQTYKNRKRYVSGNIRVTKSWRDEVRKCHKDV